MIITESTQQQYDEPLDEPVNTVDDLDFNGEELDALINNAQNLLEQENENENEECDEFDEERNSANNARYNRRDSNGMLDHEYRGFYVNPEKYIEFKESHIPSKRHRNTVIIELELV